MHMLHVVLVKLLETIIIVSFTIRAIMPKTSHQTNLTATLDITQASVVQLTQLTAEVLRLHLASRHLMIMGTKPVMAQWLHDTIHLTLVLQLHNLNDQHCHSLSTLQPPSNFRRLLQPPATSDTSIVAAATDSNIITAIERFICFDAPDCILASYIILIAATKPQQSSNNYSFPTPGHQLVIASASISCFNR